MVNGNLDSVGTCISLFFLNSSLFSLCSSAVSVVFFKSDRSFFPFELHPAACFCCYNMVDNGRVITNYHSWEVDEGGTTYKNH